MDKTDCATPARTRTGSRETRRNDHLVIMLAVVTTKGRQGQRCANAADTQRPRIGADSSEKLEWTLETRAARHSKYHSKNRNRFKLQAISCVGPGRGRSPREQTGRSSGPGSGNLDEGGGTQPAVWAAAAGISRRCSSVLMGWVRPDKDMCTTRGVHPEECGRQQPSIHPLPQSLFQLLLPLAPLRYRYRCCGRWRSQTKHVRPQSSKSRVCTGPKCWRSGLPVALRLGRQGCQRVHSPLQMAPLPVLNPLGSLPAESTISARSSARSSRLLDSFSLHATKDYYFDGASSSSWRRDLDDLPSSSCRGRQHHARTA
jgi:hypothetical protein